MKNYFIYIAFVFSVINISAEPFNLLYEKIALSGNNQFGFSAPIYCVNNDGSIITVGGNSNALNLARIYRNGEIYWNRQILGYDEFDPTKPNKYFDIQKVIFDGYSNHFTGFYRNQTLFNGFAFFHFLSSGGNIQNFAYDTTHKSAIPLYNGIGSFSQSEGRYIFINTRCELIKSDSINYMYKYFMMRFYEGAKFDKLYAYDTLPENIRPIGMNLYFPNNTIINLTFYNNVVLGDSKKKPKLSYFDRKLNYIKSITLPFTEFPEDFTFESITYIPDKDTSNLRFFATTKNPDMRMLFFEINPVSKSIKSKAFKYNKYLSICKIFYDKDRNIIIGGNCNRNISIDYGPQMFAILKFDTTFALIDSMFWKRGDNSIMRGFDKYGDDEFIVTGYYIDKDKYSFGYTARLNTNSSVINVGADEDINIQLIDDKLIIESRFPNFDIQIFDVLGRVYMNERYQGLSTIAELQNFPSGMLFVSVCAGTSRKEYRIFR